MTHYLMMAATIRISIDVMFPYVVVPRTFLYPVMFDTRLSIHELTNYLTTYIVFFKCQSLYGNLTDYLISRDDYSSLCIVV